uniref:TIL domain-containing protein n=1 Tax=Panagrolaimus sp. JU765 TaxID=591449 RepID=A0AC34PX95_9BILA
MCQKKNVCECLPGFYRDTWTNKCVEASLCPDESAVKLDLGSRVCAPNETLKFCPGCEPKCGALNKLCPAYCQPGQDCECKVGYARNSDGKCIKEEDCPVETSSAPRVVRSNGTNLVCGENERITECSGCERSCNHLDRMCKMMCNGIQACECDSGFARQSSTNKCVPISQCSANNSTNNATCGKNEVLQTCPGCEPTCSNPNPICPMICRLGTACQCKRGFVRNSAGECVLPANCVNPTPTPGDGEHVCPKNEQWSTCGSCEGTCANPHPMCTFECRPAGCYCNKKNHVRGPKGHCIHKNLCSKRAGNKTLTTRDDGLTNPCAATLCLTGSKCVVQNVKCIKAPCPPQAVCVPIDDPQVPTDGPRFIRNPFCEVARCAYGPCLPCYAPPCLNIPKCVKKAVVVSDPCEALNCTSDQICEKAMVKCKKAPCPPVARCVSASATTLPAKDDPLPTIELQQNPCATVLCGPGKVCVPKQVQCIRAPCDPIPECVDVNSTTPTKPEDDPCATVRCAAGTKCTAVKVNCLIPPCKSPIAECVPIESPTEMPIDDPCALTDCRDGMICINQQVQCIRAPCPKIAKCVNMTDVSTPAPIRNARSVDANSRLVSCDTLNCPPGTHCQFLKINCLRAPCPGSIPRCVPITNPTTQARVARAATTEVDACKTAKCPKGYTCFSATFMCAKPPCQSVARCRDPTNGAQTYPLEN